MTVGLTDSRSVCLLGERELIRGDTQRVALDPALVDEARDELLGRGDFGYLLGLDDRAKHDAMPAAGAVQREVMEQVVAPIGHCHGVDFALSFVKAGVALPPGASEGVHYGGYHVDTHAGGAGDELLRVLVNLHSRPRLFRFAAVDRRELERRGLVDAHAVDESGLADRPPQVVEIPPFDGRRLSYLTFWASVVPHVGVDTADGYFLASFEALSASGS